jgi:ATP-binding cassette subfamily B protein
MGFLMFMEILALLFPMLLKNTTDLISKDYTNTTQIVTSGLIVFGVVVLIFIVNFMGERFGAIAAAGYQKNLRAEMFEKLQNVPVERLNELGSSAILPLMMNDTVWMRQMQQRLMVLIVFFPVAILGSIMMLFRLEAMYGLFALASLPFVIIFFIINARRIGKIMQKSVPAFEDQHVQVKEGIVGAKEIRIFNKSQQREEVFAEQSWYNRQQTRTTLNAHNMSASFNSVLFSLITVGIIIYGAYTMVDISQLIILNTSIQYINRLWAGSHHIFTLFVDCVPRIKIAKQRIARVYNLPTELRGVGIRPELGTLGCVLEIIGASYKYPNDVTGLSNVNIKVEQNTRVAITGGAGSGRTVIPQLLLQYIKPSSGKITIDGTDIGDIDPTYYRRNMIAFCDQTPEFIPGTIRTNLTMLNPDATDEEILKLFKDIGAESFVAKFKNFLDHVIGEHDGFNMPTKKLLCLARSLLKPAQIYIFNQCFDHINPEYIAKIFAKLKRERKTCLFITQNNLISKHSDRIYVLTKGALAGVGKHSELLKNNPDYRDICLASAGRIISEEVNKEILHPQIQPEDVSSGGDVI